MKNTRGSEWNKWDLHIHTASSYDSPYKADDADELLCQALAENDIKAVDITDHFKIDKTRIERVYVGTIPAAVDRVNKNKKANIDSLSVHRIIEPKNDGVSWFDFDISLNAGLVAVIGNKGSGNEAIGETEQIIAKLRVLRSEFGDIKEELNVYLKKYQLEIKEDFCLKDPLEIIEQYKNKLITDKTIKQLTLNGSPMEKGLLNELKIAHDKKNDLISTSDIEEKKYQKYLNDLCFCFL